MLVNQISVFLENKTGRLAEVTKILGENKIDISALSIADTTDFGILRLIVNDPVKAESILVEKGFTVSITHVIAIAIEDKPGSLAKALEILEEKKISVEYLYAFVGKTTNKALVIIRVENPESAVEILKAEGVEVLKKEEVYSL
jgi:hypothetical protein